MKRFRLKSDINSRTKNIIAFRNTNVVVCVDSHMDIPLISLLDYVFINASTAFCTVSSQTQI